MKKPGPTYAAPVDREALQHGVFLVSLHGAAAKDNARNRQRAFDYIMEQFEEGLPPFDASDCFENGLSEDDLIFIPPSPALIMSKAKANKSPKAQDEQVLDEQALDEQAFEDQALEEMISEAEAIVLAASEILELAKLKVALANAYRDARHYKDLVFKVVDIEGGPLSEEECEIIADKSFSKSIKGLADAKVKVSQWYENASGNHELILNELAFMEEEIVTALETAEQNGRAIKEKTAEKEAVEA